MRILIDDGMQIEVGTGIGKYSLYLYQALKNELAEPDTVELLQFKKGNLPKSLRRLCYLNYINSDEFYKKCADYDIVHFTNYAMPFKKNKNVRYVVTIHDLASFLHPESLPKIYRVYSRMMIYLALKRSDVILTVSESVRQEIIERWPNVTSKIKVVYPGLYSEFSKEKIDDKYRHEKLKCLTEKEFFLFVGTIETRKNIGIVIRAFINMKEINPEIPYKLVLAGRPGYGYEKYEELIAQSKCRADIIMTGYLSADDVLRLYKNAAAYIFPTVYEGFGSTQLECMVNHLPIILSDIPTNREVSKDYGLYFKLGDEKQLQKRMEQIVNNQVDRDLLNLLADKICKNYSWDNLIHSYIDVYSELDTTK